MERKVKCTQVWKGTARFSSKDKRGVGNSEVTINFSEEDGANFEEGKTYNISFEETEPDEPVEETKGGAKTMTPANVSGKGVDLGGGKGKGDKPSVDKPGPDKPSL